MDTVLFQKKSAKKICNSKDFISICAQVNASNIGYYTMEKYKKVQCVVINETELRHEMRSKDLPIKSLMIKLSKKFKIKNLIVTRGSQGAILYNSTKKYFFTSVCNTNYRQSWNRRCNDVFTIVVFKK